METYNEPQSGDSPGLQPRAYHCATARRPSVLKFMNPFKMNEDEENMGLEKEVQEIKFNQLLFE